MDSITSSERSDLVQAVHSRLQALRAVLNTTQIILLSVALISQRQHWLLRGTIHTKAFGLYSAKAIEQMILGYGFFLNNRLISTYWDGLQGDIQKSKKERKKQNRTNNIADCAANRILMTTFIFHPVCYLYTKGTVMCTALQRGGSGFRDEVYILIFIQQDLFCVLGNRLINRYSEAISVTYYWCK